MDQYSVRNNLVLQFKRDTIDQSPQLADTLFKRFGRDGELQYSRRVIFDRRVVGREEGEEDNFAEYLVFLFLAVSP